MGLLSKLKSAVSPGGRKSVADAPPQVEITEQSSPLDAWSAEDGPEGLKRIEQDVRALMRQLAETKFQLAEQERKQTEEARRLYLAVLEVMDALDRVFRSIQAKDDQVTPQMRKWLGNFRTVRALLDRILTDRGVVRIENLGQSFDPNWHKVAEVVVDTTRPEGTIVEEVQRGYVWRNTVLRRAEVVVVRHSDTGEGAEVQSEGEPSDG